MGSGFSKMKKQARQMEQQLEAMRSEMKTKMITGSAGNGLVSVTINGNKEPQSLKINPDCIDKNDVEGLQDLILAALQDAHQKLEAENPEKQSGLPFPFM